MKTISVNITANTGESRIDVMTINDVKLLLEQLKHKQGVYVEIITDDI